jgi:hypothetical protein
MENTEKIHNVEVTTTENEGNNQKIVSKIVINKKLSHGGIVYLYIINIVLDDATNMSYIAQRWEYGKCQETIKLFLSSKSMQKLIDDLKIFFKYGRTMSKQKNTWSPVGGALYFDLSYRNVKKILGFERRASKLPLMKLPKAIRTMDPTNINTRVDCGDYVIEAWGGIGSKRHYTCLTFNKDTADWLKAQVVS